MPVPLLLTVWAFAAIVMQPVARRAARTICFARDEAKLIKRILTSHCLLGLKTAESRSSRPGLFRDTDCKGNRKQVLIAVLCPEQLSERKIGGPRNNRFPK